MILEHNYAIQVDFKGWACKSLASGSRARYPRHQVWIAQLPRPRNPTESKRSFEGILEDLRRSGPAPWGNLIVETKSNCEAEQSQAEGASEAASDEIHVDLLKCGHGSTVSGQGSSVIH